MDDKAIADYERIRPRPYFGRVDFLQEGRDQADKRYIGTDYVPYHVISWVSPFAEQLYYAEPQKVSGYDVPRSQLKGGPIRVHGSITLKRHLAIDRAKLLDVTEVYQLPPPTEDRRQATDSRESFMIEQLSRRRGGRLRETVATIQPEQYQQIAATTNEIMLVQGVAGSGKSIVGLHRIAYLLSPFNRRPDAKNIDASRVVFYGPTRAFLDYVSGLLPSLNVRDVLQLTVTGWLLSTMSRRISLDTKEPLLEKLLRLKDKKWQEAHQAAKVKGSLEMSRFLERHVLTLRKKFTASGMALSARFESAVPLVVDTGRVRRVMRSRFDRPLNDDRSHAIEGVVQLLWEAYVVRNRRLTAEAFRKKRMDFNEAVRPQVERQITTIWPAVDFRKEYRRLLTDPALLHDASSKRLGPEKSAILAESLPRGPTVFRAEDLGPLCYLDHLLNDHSDPQFHHVVLDEAQEISPIELLVIKRHTRGNGFTILGDLTQSLSPQGIDRWGDILQLFRGQGRSRHVIRISFRATREITRFANRVLKRVAPKSTTAVAFNRMGPPPSFRRSRSYQEMVDAIASDIGELKEHGASTVGVLCRTMVEAQRLHRDLTDRGVKGLGLTAREKPSSRNIVVAPVSLTRGMEYDAVIVAGASKANFPPTTLHGRILYLAVSRAAHELRIHWFGQVASQIPVPDKPHRKKLRKGTRKPRRTRQRSKNPTTV
jgi:DNA helicase-2/ATP-dependent DNA helicase PcrA